MKKSIALSSIVFDLFVKKFLIIMVVCLFSCMVARQMYAQEEKILQNKDMDMILSFGEETSIKDVIMILCKEKKWQCEIDLPENLKIKSYTGNLENFFIFLKTKGIIVTQKTPYQFSFKYANILSMNLDNNFTSKYSAPIQKKEVAAGFTSNSSVSNNTVAGNSLVTANLLPTNNLLKNVGGQSFFISFKDAPFFEVLDTFARIYEFSYIIEPVTTGDSKGAIDLPSIPGIILGQKQEMSHNQNSGLYSSLASKRVSFSLVDGSYSKDEILNLFCRVADVSCELDKGKKIMHISPYTMYIFDRSFFFDYNIDKSISLEYKSTTGGTGETSSSSGNNNIKTSEKFDDFVSKVIKPLLSSEGKIVYSPRGYIVVVDKPSIIERVKKIVETEKEKESPISLSIKVVRVDLNDNYQRGIDWNGIINGVIDRGVKVTLSSNLAGPVIGGSGTTGGTPGFTLSLERPDRINVLLALLKQYGDVSIVHDFQVKARNGLPVLYEDVESVPYLTQSTVALGSGTSTTTSVATTPTFVDVGLKINILGNIKDGKENKDKKLYEGSVFVEVSLLTSIDNLGSASSPYYVPRVKSSTLSVPFSLLSNESMVLSAFKVDKKEIQWNKVPLFSDLPILGHLFGYKKEDKGHAELIIIITPEIKS